MPETYQHSKIGRLCERYDKIDLSYDCRTRVIFIPENNLIVVAERINDIVTNIKSKTIINYCPFCGRRL